MELSQRRERLLKRLHTARQRARESLVLVEGIRAASEALDAGAEVSFAVLSEGLVHADAGDALRRALAVRAIETAEVSDRQLAELADTDHPQGVLLVCAEPVADLEDVFAPSDARLLVLDAVQDPGNVGTLVRSAVAFGWDGVVALDGTGDPWGSKAVRASAGTVFRLPVVRCGFEVALPALEDAGIRVLAAAAEGTPVRSTARAGEAGGAVALVLGNEGAGVRDAVKAAAAGMISVPMRGAAESLNVGVAGSILMYELTGDPA